MTASTVHDIDSPNQQSRDRSMSSRKMRKQSRLLDDDESIRSGLSSRSGASSRSAASSRASSQNHDRDRDRSDMERHNSRGAERRPSRGADREDDSWNNNPIAGSGMRGGGTRSAERPRKHTSMQPQRSTERVDRMQRRPSAPSNTTQSDSKQQARRTARKKEADDNIKVVV